MNNSNEIIKLIYLKISVFIVEKSLHINDLNTQINTKNLRSVRLKLTETSGFIMKKITTIIYFIQRLWLCYNTITWKMFNAKKANKLSYP